MRTFSFKVDGVNTISDVQKMYIRLAEINTEACVDACTNARLIPQNGNFYFVIGHALSRVDIRFDGDQFVVTSEIDISPKMESTIRSAFEFLAEEALLPVPNPTVALRCLPHLWAMLPQVPFQSEWMGSDGFVPSTVTTARLPAIWASVTPNNRMILGRRLASGENAVVYQGTVRHPEVWLVRAPEHMLFPGSTSCLFATTTVWDTQRFLIEFASALSASLAQLISDPDYRREIQMRA